MEKLNAHAHTHAQTHANGTARTQILAEVANFGKGNHDPGDPCSTTPVSTKRARARAHTLSAKKREPQPQEGKKVRQGRWSNGECRRVRQDDAKEGAPVPRSANQAESEDTDWPPGLAAVERGNEWSIPYAAKW